MSFVYNDSLNFFIIINDAYEVNKTMMYLLVMYLLESISHTDIDIVIVQTFTVLH